MKCIKNSFYDWCIEHNRIDLNDRFDTDKNNCSTKEISCKTNKQYWFKCPKGIHESEQHKMCVVTVNSTQELSCKKCRSVAQMIIDKFGESYLWSRWHKSNIDNPWDVSYGNSRKKYFFQCLDKDYHVYSQTPQSFSRGVGCPYCNGKMVHPNDSIAILYPDIIDRWSNKNIKSAYEYTLKSNKKVWLKCPLGKHDDYYQALNNAYQYNYRCPECYKDMLSLKMRGSNNHFWKGGINGENDTLRHRREYKEWRIAVYERDDYTCQCCGQKGGKLNAHHINPFSEYPDLRYNVDNGITLCTNCHDSTVEGSFHNANGTHNTTAEQLRNYILNKSNKDIYIINPNLLYNT